MITRQMYILAICFHIIKIYSQRGAILHKDAILIHPRSNSKATLNPLTLSLDENVKDREGLFDRTSFAGPAEHGSVAYYRLFTHDAKVGTNDTFTNLMTGDGFVRIMVNGRCLKNDKPKLVFDECPYESTPFEEAKKFEWIVSSHLRTEDFEKCKAVIAREESLDKNPPPGEKEKGEEELRVDEKTSGSKEESEVEEGKAVKDTKPGVREDEEKADSTSKKDAIPSEDEKRVDNERKEEEKRKEEREERRKKEDKRREDERLEEESREAKIKEAEKEEYERKRRNEEKRVDDKRTEREDADRRLNAKRKEDEEEDERRRKRGDDRRIPAKEDDARRAEPERDYRDRNNAKIREPFGEADHRESQRTTGEEEKRTYRPRDAPSTYDTPRDREKERTHWRTKEYPPESPGDPYRPRDNDPRADRYSVKTADRPYRSTNLRYPDEFGESQPLAQRPGDGLSSNGSHLRENDPLDSPHGRSNPLAIYEYLLKAARDYKDYSR